MRRPLFFPELINRLEMEDSVEHQFSDASEEGENLEGGDLINQEQVRGVVIGGEGREGEGTIQQAEVETGDDPGTNGIVH